MLGHFIDKIGNVLSIKLSSMNCPSYEMSFYMKYLCMTCPNRSGLCNFQGEGRIFLNSKFKHYKRWLHSLLLLLIFPGGYVPPNSPGRVHPPPFSREGYVSRSNFPERIFFLHNKNKTTVSLNTILFHAKIVRRS